MTLRPQRLTLLAVALGLVLGANPTWGQPPGDLDGDGDVDRDDLQVILGARGTPATGPDDARDLDGDGTLTTLDARKLALLCARPLCELEPTGELVVAAQVDRSTGLVGTSFTLSGRTVQTTAPVESWRWTLSDGRELDGQSVTVSFPEAGLYGARLQATDREGNTQEAETGVAVFDPSLQAPPEMGLPDLIGDVDGDGEITLADAHKVAKHAGGLDPLPGDALSAADVDLDGEVAQADALLLGEAVASGATLPTALLPAQGPPGRRVTLISPKLLDPLSRVEIQVGESTSLQSPLRMVRGYASFIIPFDATVAGSTEVEPGPVEVRVLRDGAVVETLTYRVEEPEPLPEDPKAALLGFLDDYEALFELNRQSLAELLEVSGVDGEEEELLLATLTAAQEGLGTQMDELRRLLERPGGADLARLFFRFGNAQGLGDLRQRLDLQIEEQRLALAELRKAVAAGTVDTDEILAIVCAVRDASELLDTGAKILSTGCDALLLTAVAAALSPFDGVVGESALLFTWAKFCGDVEASVQVALVLLDMVKPIEHDLRFDASPTAPAPGETVELRAEIEASGLAPLCEFTVGRTRDKLIEQLSQLAVQRLLRHKFSLRAISEAAEWLSEDLEEELKGELESLVQGTIDDSAIGRMLEEFANRVCDLFRTGPPVLGDLSRMLEGPTPDVGTVVFNQDGTATYTCPVAGAASGTVTFVAARELCGESVEKTAEVSCNGETVTITMGDNGNLNDDIFEVRIQGETVLTSSSPVRSTSTTVALPPGTHVVEMIGRAAPDGIGTYFISFSGATVIGGDPTSGTDLTPGVVKTFTIRVE